MIKTISQEEKQKATKIGHVNSQLSIPFANTCISWQPENLSGCYQMGVETGNLSLVSKKTVLEYPDV